MIRTTAFSICFHLAGLFFSLSAMAGAAAECPLGAKEDHLTIQRVMINFGKYVSDADAVAQKGLRPQETVTDAEIQAAADRLQIAIQCAEAVIQNPSGDLLPGPAFFMKEEAAKKEYIDDFVTFMGDFKDGLVDYRKVLLETLALKPEQRDFHAVMEQTQEVNKRVDRAHSKLFH